MDFVICNLGAVIMKKAVNILGWISVICTLMSLLFTLMCTYLFIYIKYFDGYFTFQCCMIITMIIWSIKMYSWKETSKCVVYSMCCLFIAAGTVFFMFMKVY